MFLSRKNYATNYVNLMLRSRGSASIDVLCLLTRAAATIKKIGADTGMAPDHDMSSPPGLSTKARNKIWGFMDGVDMTCLPAPMLLDDAYTLLLTSLRPHTQQKATHAGVGTKLVEPTLALYCLLDGGDVSVC
jgi:hypothetical protein